MKRKHEINYDSDQERSKLKYDGFTAASQTGKEELNHQSIIKKNVSGQIKLVGLPYYSLALDTGSDLIPLVLVDSARHLVHWMSSVGRKVVINKLLAVCDRFQRRDGKDPIEHRNYIVKWEDVRLEEDEERNDSEVGKNTEIQKVGHELDNERTCNIIVHHVSIPFHDGEDTLVSCLILISYIDRSNIEEQRWLLLQREQVAWKDFLVPNREYKLLFPLGSDKYLFDKNHKPLGSIIKIFRELQVIDHHKRLFISHRNSTLNASIVPPGSKLFLSRNTDFSEYVYRFTSKLLWFRSWFSVSEADYASSPLITIYGKVESVSYLNEDVFKSCYLCIQKEPKKPVIHTPKSPVSQSWLDPFKSRLELEPDELVELPNITDNGDTRMPMGVPGKLVQLIKLRDLLTGEGLCIYTKHSFVGSCQQMARLAEGVCVSLSHLNRRCSVRGHFYYITTMMTSCRVLDYGNRDGWGLYGMCKVSRDSSIKTWGVLEPFDVSKVSVRAKCDSCKASFFQGICSNTCGGQTFTASAYAVAWIDITHDGKRVTKEKMLMNDDLVRKWLGMPERMWQLLGNAAAHMEIVSFLDQELNDFDGPVSLERSFQIYCCVVAKKKFYVSVRKLSSEGDGELYYCIDLEPINLERLAIVAELVAQK